MEQIKFLKELDMGTYGHEDDRFPIDTPIGVPVGAIFDKPDGKDYYEGWELAPNGDKAIKLWLTTSIVKKMVEEGKVEYVSRPE